MQRVNGFAAVMISAAVVLGFPSLAGASGLEIVAAGRETPPGAWAQATELGTTGSSGHRMRCSFKSA
jgi:hypothetical protein